MTGNVVITIRWVDPSGEMEWKDKEEARKSKVEEIESLGYLLYEDAEKVIISMEDPKQGDTNTRGIIPKICIKEIKQWQLSAI